MQLVSKKCSVVALSSCDLRLGWTAALSVRFFACWSSPERSSACGRPCERVVLRNSDFIDGDVDQEVDTSSMLNAQFFLQHFELLSLSAGEERPTGGQGVLARGARSWTEYITV